MIRRQARIGVNDQLAAVIPRQQAQRALQHVADVVGESGVDDLAEAALREVAVLRGGRGGGGGRGTPRSGADTGGEGGEGEPAGEGQGDDWHRGGRGGQGTPR